MLALQVFATSPSGLSNIQMKLHGPHMLPVLFMAPEFISGFPHLAQESFLYKDVPWLFRNIPTNKIWGFWFFILKSFLLVTNGQYLFHISLHVCTKNYKDLPISHISYSTLLLQPDYIFINSTSISQPPTKSKALKEHKQKEGQLSAHGLKFWEYNAVDSPYSSGFTYF